MENETKTFLEAMTIFRIAWLRLMARATYRLHLYKLSKHYVVMRRYEINRLWEIRKGLS